MRPQKQGLSAKKQMFHIFNRHIGDAKKTDSGIIFLIHFTLTLYRDLHIMSNKSLGRRTPIKVELFSPGESKFGIASWRFGNPKPAECQWKKKRPRKCRRSLFMKKHFVCVYEDILVYEYEDDPHSRTSAPGFYKNILVMQTILNLGPAPLLPYPHPFKIL